MHGKDINKAENLTFILHKSENGPWLSLRKW